MGLTSPSISNSAYDIISSSLSALCSPTQPVFRRCALRCRSLLRDSVHVRVPLNATQPFPLVDEIILAAGSCRPRTSPLAAASYAGPPGCSESGSAVAGTVQDSAADLAAVRSYLAAARGTSGYKLADGMSAILEQYFVDSRRPEAQGGAQAAAPAGPNVAAAAAAAGSGVGLSVEEFQTKLTVRRARCGCSKTSNLR